MFFASDNWRKCNVSNGTSAEQALIGTLSRLACSLAGSLLVTSGFCNARMADSAPRNGELACKACYLADFSTQLVWIALDDHDAKVADGRELTKRNLVSAKPQTVPCQTLTGTEQARIRNRGTRFDLPASCTFTWTLTYHMSKTSDRPVLRPV